MPQPSNRRPWIVLTKRSCVRDIVARSVTLTDSKGKPRIYLGVLDKPAYASICLFGAKRRQIEISADHQGGLRLSLRDATGKLIIGLGISAKNRVGLSLFDHRSGTRTEIGSDGTGRPHHVTLHHHGRIHWTTRKAQRARTKNGRRLYSSSD